MEDLKYKIFCGDLTPVTIECNDGSFISYKEVLEDIYHFKILFESKMKESNERVIKFSENTLGEIKLVFEVASYGLHEVCNKYNFTCDETLSVLELCHYFLNFRYLEPEFMCRISNYMSCLEYEKKILELEETILSIILNNPEFFDREKYWNMVKNEKIYRILNISSINFLLFRVNQMDLELFEIHEFLWLEDKWTETIIKKLEYYKYTPDITNLDFFKHLSEKTKKKYNKYLKSSFIHNEIKLWPCVTVELFDKIIEDDSIFIDKLLYGKYLTVEMRNNCLNSIRQTISSGILSVSWNSDHKIKVIPMIKFLAMNALTLDKFIQISKLNYASSSEDFTKKYFACVRDYSKPKIIQKQ